MVSTFVVHTQRKRDALARVVLLFHRRALNIEALTLVHIKEADVLLMTISVEADGVQSQLIEANLHKLVDVLLVENITA
jgi:acetolactate synthase-1/3 small subunit